MKNVFILLCFLSLTLIGGCSDETETYKKEEQTKVLELIGISQNPYSSDGKTVTVKVKSDTSWELLIEPVDQDWLSFDKNKGEPTDGAYVGLEMMIAPNTINEERKTRVRLKSDTGVEKEYTVTQQKGREQAVLGLMGIKQDELYPAEGDVIEVKLKASSKWTLAVSKTGVEKWLSFDKAEGDATGDEFLLLKMNIDPNQNYSTRKALVTLKSFDGKNERTYWVNQNAAVFEIKDPDDMWIGGPEAVADESKFDDNYPQMKEWLKAGVEGGIPSLSEQAVNVGKAFMPGSSVSEIQRTLDENRYKTPFIVLLQNGEYNFGDKGIKIHSGQTVIGESRDGVIINVTNALLSPVIDLKDAQNAGVRRLTVIGKFRDGNPRPMDNWQVISGGDGKQVVINMRGDCRNSFVDDVYLKNSASHPICVGGAHNTVRAAEIDGAWNKGGGFQGYFFIGGEYALITGCKVTNLRHFSMQDPTSKYNVIYGNELIQEISFHNNDGGNNLVEHNKITIPDYFTDRPPFLGPWSTQHKVGPENYLYDNMCSDTKYDPNHGGKNKWTDNTKVFVGPKYVTSGGVSTSGLDRCYDNFPDSGKPAPRGGTLYPITKK